MPLSRAARKIGDQDGHVKADLKLQAAATARLGLVVTVCVVPPHAADHRGLLKHVQTSITSFEELRRYQQAGKAGANDTSAGVQIGQGELCACDVLERSFNMSRGCIAR